MKLKLTPYGDKELEISSTVFKSAESIERFIKSLKIAALVVWPETKPQGKK